MPVLTQNLGTTCSPSIRGDEEAKPVAAQKLGTTCSPSICGDMEAKDQCSTLMTMDYGLCSMCVPAAKVSAATAVDPNLADRQHRVVAMTTSTA